MARPRLQIPSIAAPAGPAASASSVGAATRRGSVSEEVYQRLRAAVLDCTLLPGTALSEQAVSEELGVSRAPVREAFRQLTGDGLLEVMPQRGSYVARLSRERIADAIFVREAIECRAAEQAALAAAALRKSLEPILQRQAAASDAGDYGQHLSSDEQLHHQILVVAGHPHAWAPLRLARTGMNRIRHLAIPGLGSNRTAIDQHARLVKAIVRGDATSAVARMREHIREPLRYVEQIHAQSPAFFSD